MAKDTRRPAVSRLHTECCCGRRRWRFPANISQSRGPAFISNEILVAKQDASFKVRFKVTFEGTTKVCIDFATKEVMQCRSHLTFLGLCENLRRDTVASRSNTRPQLWPRRCRRFGRSIPAFEIASQ